jgi:UMF1 family MFS transporter
LGNRAFPPNRSRLEAFLKSTSERRTVFSWALYDWANSAFSTTVMAGFFPVFFKQYASAGADSAESTLRLGTANAAASVIVALLAPILGAIADSAGTRKKFLFYFAAMGIVMTGALRFVQAGQWEIAVLVYAAAAVGFSAANSFYDSLLVGVAREGRSDFVSALGFAFGYLGGGVLFAANVAMTLRPAWFGLSGEEEALRVSFLTVAVWWAVFSIPLFLHVDEPPRRTAGRGGSVAEAFRQIARTFAEVKKLRAVLLFLLGYWCYIDGVDTITRMAVDYGLSIGFDAKNLVAALLITQFVGFPAAVIFGRIGEKKGAKKGIYIGIAVYVAVCVWAFRMREVWEFYGLAVSVGLVLGGIQALSRSFYSRIIPRDKAAEYFGFYNMLGKSAAVIGPLIMGGVGAATGNPRLAILSVIVLLAAGAVLLSRVSEAEGARAAREMESARPPDGVTCEIPPGGGV